MKKLHGGGEKGDGKSGVSDWEWHDWYWNFKAERTWNKRRSAKADTCASDEETTAHQPRPNPGRGAAQSASGKENLRSQLAGLRHRAAVRATKPPTVASTPMSSQQEQSCCEAEVAAASCAVTASDEMSPAIRRGVSEDTSSPASQPTGAVQAAEDQELGNVEEEPEPFSCGRRPAKKFVAHTDQRDQVVGQLAGLRRKAALKHQAA